MIKKLYKGIFLISMFFMFGFFVNADECPVENDDSKELDRIMLCSAEKYLTTRYIYPEVGQVEVFKNDLCSIKCSENVLFLVDKAKNVRAGMGFSFPLFASGQRTCNATYNYKEFDENLRKLVADRDAASGDARETIVNEISNQIQIKDACDAWLGKVEEKGKEYPKYGFNNSGLAVLLLVETSQGNTEIGYSFRQSGYESTVNEETTKYDSCDLKGDANGNCVTESDTTSSWTEISRVDGRFTMNDVYVEKYTGQVKPVPSSTTCDAKDIYFTSFYEISFPNSSNPTANGYKLKLTASNLGNNIDVISGGVGNDIAKFSGDKWKLTIDCWYKLKNLIFPQSTSTTIDDYYGMFGGTAFMYRQINLESPFPNRDPGENWKGKEKLITGVNTKTVAYEQGIYTIELDGEKIRRVKDYNDDNPYDTFNLNDMEKSWFITEYDDIVKRKK